MPQTVRELIRRLTADGWVLVATKGSHRQYKHPVKAGKVTVAGKLSSSVAHKTERSILDQAGLSEDTT